MRHGCTSTRGAEQNLGSTSSANRPGWRFVLFHTASSEAVGLKQSSRSVSVITARDQQLPSPAAGPCRTAAPQQGLEREAWQVVSLPTLLHCLLINKLNILIAFEHKACAQLNVTERFFLPLSPPNVLLGKLVGQKVSRYQQFSVLELQPLSAQVNSRTGQETPS